MDIDERVESYKKAGLSDADMQVVREGENKGVYLKAGGIKKFVQLAAQDQGVGSKPSKMLEFIDGEYGYQVSNGENHEEAEKKAVFDAINAFGLGPDILG